MTPLAGVLIWALAFATSDEELDSWWRQHKELIGRLTPEDRDRLVAAGRETRARIERSRRTVASMRQ